MKPDPGRAQQEISTRFQRGNASRWLTPSTIGTKRRLRSRLVARIENRGSARIFRTASWAVPDQTMADMAIAIAWLSPASTAAAPKTAPQANVPPRKGKLSRKPWRSGAASGAARASR